MLQYFINSHTLTHLVYQYIVMCLTILLIPRLYVTSIFGALFTLFGIALVNTYFWDANLFMTLPTELTTQALVLVLVNGLIFWLIVKLLPGITVRGILPALIAPVVFSFLNIGLKQAAADGTLYNVFNIIVGYMNQLRSYVSRPL